MAVQVSVTTGDRISISFPEPRGIDSFFAFGLHKSGSVLLNRMITDVCASLDIPVIALERDMFSQGYGPEDLQGDISSLFEDRGYAYISFRTFWCRNVDYDFSSRKKILLVRDPRDAMISYYFSTKCSHTIPDAGPLKKTLLDHRQELHETNEPAEAFEMIKTRSRLLRRDIEVYLNDLDGENTVIYRYEDIIFRKEEWLRHMLAFLGLSLGEEEIVEIARRQDVLPRQERPGKHIRQVVPGNYRKHFPEDIIAWLNEELRGVLRALGYDTVLSFSPAALPLFGPAAR